MEDENNGVLMTKFVGLRAKMYAVRMDGTKDTKKVKDVKNNVVQRMITFDDTAFERRDRNDLPSIVYTI